MIARAWDSPQRPILVHIIPVRQCNLSCTYCNEYDDFSKPVPTAEMVRRIDLLAALGSLSVHLSGGEPLLHPEVDRIIHHIRERGMFAGLLTNGYLLNIDRIKRLNLAGLDYMQISIDNVIPDDTSKKSLKVLDQKLRWLADYAEFEVNINSVVGSSVAHPQDALAIAERARSLKFKSGVGIIHDGTGRLRRLDGQQWKIYEDIARYRKASFWNFVRYDEFQSNLARGLPNDWHCHAGSRYLYICEDGLVHYCSQQRGRPGIPLERYTVEDLEREYDTVKPCAPYCTITCVHRVTIVDEFRENPRVAMSRFFPQRLPIPVKILRWLFLPEKRGRPTLSAKLASKLMSGANASPIGRSDQVMSGANASAVARSRKRLRLPMSGKE
jgi:MoaA/NifB/PqqE/SkfB family radical SAM enzyme